MAPDPEFNKPFICPLVLNDIHQMLPTPSAAYLLYMEREYQLDPPQNAQWSYCSVRRLPTGILADFQSPLRAMYRRVVVPPAQPTTVPPPPPQHQDVHLNTLMDLQDRLFRNVSQINQVRSVNATTSFRQFWETGVNSQRRTWLVPGRMWDDERFNLGNLRAPRHIRAVRTWDIGRWYSLGDFYGFRWRARGSLLPECRCEWAAYCGVTHFLPKELFRVQHGPAESGTVSPAPPSSPSDAMDSDDESSDDGDATMVGGGGNGGDEEDDESELSSGEGSGEDGEDDDGDIPVRDARAPSEAMRGVSMLNLSSQSLLEELQQQESSLPALAAPEQLSDEGKSKKRRAPTSSPHRSSSPPVPDVEVL
ncbi:hypothetical protein BJ508DRAFT_333075 [Ascobolus immersus RN42]|uniref:Uncharacterized protein n=1 Tax=Ascobolus immersus RN42 TaxID=1160509 RepID=A0A3N4HKV1_ASCIM|nr:hypothetical protein BJ508DRAFT_333075 [Ascobolus immersus RN42]